MPLSAEQTLRSSYPDSFYARTLSETTRRTPLSSTIDVEICIVGGGLAGVATGLDLAERGRAAAVLEQHQVGWGASGRSGGFVSDGFIVDVTALNKKLGKDDAAALYALSRVGHDLVRERVKRYAIDCDLKASGALSCALHNRNEGLEAYRDFVGENFGVELEYWPRHRVAEALDCPLYGDAICNPRTDSVHPLNLVRGLARAFESLGGKIYEHTPALELKADGAHWLVRTPDAQIRAQQVVIACGGYVGRLWPALANATVPIASHIMVVKPLDADLDRVIGVPHVISDFQVLPNYYRKLADGLLLWGGRASAWEPSAERIGQMLSRDLRRYYPKLQRFEIKSAWSGQMSYLAHAMPSIGSLGSGLWYASGFGGLGMAATSMAGRLIAAAICDNDDQ